MQKYLLHCCLKYDLSVQELSNEERHSKQPRTGDPETHELLRNPREAANSLHSPGNPAYQKHLKNSSTTIKLT